MERVGAARDPPLAFVEVVAAIAAVDVGRRSRPRSDANDRVRRNNTGGRGHCASAVETTQGEADGEEEDDKERSLDHHGHRRECG